MVSKLSPWILDRVPDPVTPTVDRYYFNLDTTTPGLNTEPVVTSEYYAWAEGPFPILGAPTEKIPGLFLPLTRWTKLRNAIPNDPTKCQSWANLIGAPVLDGRLANGLGVYVDFAGSTANGSRPKPAYFNEIFKTGQAKYAQSCVGISKSWIPTTIDYPVWDATTKESIMEKGWGFRMDITPPEELYGVKQKYFKLRNADLKRLGLTGANSPDQIYIPVDAVKQYQYAVDANNPHLLAVRNETGVLSWVKCAKAVNLKKPAVWDKWMENGIRAIDRDGPWSRRIDPGITLYIRPAGNSGMNLAKLTDLFLRVKSEVKCKQDFQMLVDVPEKQIRAEYKSLGLSPFHDFETLISEKDWVSYNTAFPDRQWPADLEAVKTASAALTKSISKRKSAKREDWGSGYLTFHELNVERIELAMGTRREVPTQGGVMGGSASDIADAFEWDGATERMEKTTNPMWPGTSNMPAEWLHCVAYSWGGIGPTPTYRSSQVQENLIFGSSECNSLMTRYEKSYQALLVKEEQYRKEIKHVIFRKVTARLMIRMDRLDIRKSTNASPFSELAQSPPYMVNDDANWEAWDKTATWLYFSLDYGFHVNQRLGLMGATRSMWLTTFYPFQRGFYTVLESEVDLQLLDDFRRDREKEAESQGVIVTESRPPVVLMASSVKIGPSVAVPSNSSGDSLPAGTHEALDAKPPDSSPSTATSPMGENDGPGGAGTDDEQNSENDTLWVAVCAGPAVLTIDGITISKPVLLILDETGTESPVPATKIGVDDRGNGIPLSSHQRGPPSTIPNTPPEFVVQGEINLYGLQLPGVTFSTVKGKQAPGVLQRVKLPSLSLGKLIPEFKGTVLDAIALENTVLSYHSYSRGPERPPGMHIRTDITISGNDTLQPVSDVLSKVFGQEHPSLTVSGYLSNNCHWGSPVVPTGFTLSASLMKMEVKLCDVVELTDIGIDLIADRAVKPDIGLTYDFHHVYWGGANVMIPGCVVPLRVDWHLSPTPDSYSFSMTLQDEQWKDVMGVKGLNVENVQFGVSWEKGAAMDTVDLDIQATMKLRSGTVLLKGQYSKTSWLLECELDDVDLTALEEIYQDVFGVEINSVGDTHDITFKELTLTISKADGLVFKGEVTVNGHTAASATVSLNSAGLEIKGSVENVSPDGLVEIENAQLDVFIGVATSNTGRPIRVQINGKVKWQGLEIDAGLFIENIPGQPVQWTVYGLLEGHLKLSRLSTAIENTWLDLDLTQVAFFASNQSIIPEQVPNRFKYPVKKGLQLCATLVGPLSAVDGVTKTKAGGLTLCVASNTDSLTVEVLLPLEKDLTFNKNIKSGILTFEIVISENPHVKVTADLTVVVAHQPNPLELKLELKAGDSTAEGKAMLIGPWKDPFGLSPDLAISNLYLEIDILYETFLETGVPKTLKIGGEVAVGTAMGVVDLVVSEDPTQELISASVTNVDLSSIFTLGNTVTMASSTAPAEHNGTLKLMELVLYLSTGATVNGVNHPAGISFNCKMDIFNHTAEVHATVGEQITLGGDIDPFALGPLSVTGFKDPRATVDIAIGPTDNHIILDGAVIICSITAGVSVAIQLSPNPSITFIAKVAFAEALEFDLNATMIGSFDGTGSGDLDFSLEVDMHQEILKHIIKEAQDHFKAMFDASQASDADQEKALDALEAGFKVDLQNAEDWVNQKKLLADQKRAEVNKAFDDEKAALDWEKAYKEAQLTRTENDLKLEIQKFEVALDQTKMDVAKEINDSKVAIETAARDGEAKIESWKKTVNEKQTALNVAYGDVEAAMKAAQDDLGAAQYNLRLKEDQITGTNMQIDNSGYWDGLRLHWDLLEYVVERDALAAIEWVAQKALDIGNAVINEAFDLAKDVLADAQRILSAGEADIAAVALDLEHDLDLVQQAADSAIDEAEKALDAVSKGPLKALFNEAKSLLDDFVNALKDALSGVQAALDTIEQAVEIVAYNLAMESLEVVRNNIKRLDPLRLALTLEEDAEKALNSIVQEALLIGGNILDVQEVKFSGSLRGLHTGSQPLSGTIVVVLAGTTHTLTCTYRPGGIEEFLKALWADVCNLL